MASSSDAVAIPLVFQFHRGMKKLFGRLIKAFFTLQAELRREAGAEESPSIWQAVLEDHCRHIMADSASTATDIARQSRE